MAVVLAWSALAHADATAPAAPTNEPPKRRTPICIRGTLDCASVVLLEHGLGVRLESESNNVDPGIDVDAGLLLQRWPRHRADEGTRTTVLEAGISIRLGGYVALPVLLVTAYALSRAD